MKDECKGVKCKGAKVENTKTFKRQKMSVKV